MNSNLINAAIVAQCAVTPSHLKAVGRKAYEIALKGDCRFSDDGHAIISARQAGEITAQIMGEFLATGDIAGLKAIRDCLATGVSVRKLAADFADTRKVFSTKKQALEYLESESAPDFYEVESFAFSPVSESATSEPETVTSEPAIVESDKETKAKRKAA